MKSMSELSGYLYGIKKWIIVQVREMLKRRHLAVRHKEQYDDRWWQIAYHYVPKRQIVKTGHGRVTTTGLITYPINQLRCTILRDDRRVCLPVGNTVYYAWISDVVAHRNDTCTRKEYGSYIKRYYPDDSPEMSIERVIALIRRGMHTALDPIVIFVPVRQDADSNDVALIYDGNHRAALALAKGCVTTPVLVLDQHISYSDIPSHQ